MKTAGMLVVILAIFSVSCGRENSQRTNDTANADSARADSTRADSAHADTVAAQERDDPCFASHLGLPCR
jgi:hypothetical protein